MVGMQTVTVEWRKIKNVVVTLKKEFTNPMLRSKAETLSNLTERDLPAMTTGGTWRSGLL